MIAAVVSIALGLGLVLRPTPPATRSDDPRLQASGAVDLTSLVWHQEAADHVPGRWNTAAPVEVKPLGDGHVAVLSGGLLVHLDTATGEVLQREAVETPARLDNLGRTVRTTSTAWISPDGAWLDPSDGTETILTVAESTVVTAREDLVVVRDRTTGDVVQQWLLAEDAGTAGRTPAAVTAGARLLLVGGDNGEAGDAVLDLATGDVVPLTSRLDLPVRAATLADDGSPLVLSWDAAGAYGDRPGYLVESTGALLTAPSNEVVFLGLRHGVQLDRHVAADASLVVFAAPDHRAEPWSATVSVYGATVGTSWATALPGWHLEALAVVDGRAVVVVDGVVHLLDSAGTPVGSVATSPRSPRGGEPTTTWSALAPVDGVLALRGRRDGLVLRDVASGEVVADLRGRTGPMLDPWRRTPSGWVGVVASQQAVLVPATEPDVTTLAPRAAGILGSTATSVVLVENWPAGRLITVDVATGQQTATLDLATLEEHPEAVTSGRLVTRRWGRDDLAVRHLDRLETVERTIPAPGRLVRATGDRVLLEAPGEPPGPRRTTVAELTSGATTTFETPPGALVDSALLLDDAVVLLTPQGLQQVELVTGRSRWTTSLPGVTSLPVVVGRQVLVGTLDGVVAVSLADGEVAAVTDAGLVDGPVRWLYPAGDHLVTGGDGWTAAFTIR